MLLPLPNPSDSGTPLNNELNAFSEQLADVVGALAPSVVRILHPRFPGTGIVWSAEGHILTTARRARRGGPIQVSINGGDAQEAVLIGRDPGSDLALWKVDAEGLSPAPFDDDSRAPRVGEIVLTLGRPGPSVGAAFGLLSGVGAAWRSPLGAAIDRYLNVDGSLPPGFAGGALVRSSGAVLGLNSRHLSHGGTTVPASTIRRVVAELLEHGEVKRPWLGVGVQQVALPSDVASGLERSRGVLVTALEADSPAAAAGLLVGDTLVALGQDPVSSPDELLLALARAGAGAGVRVHLVRGGKLELLDLEVGERTVEERRGPRGRKGGGHGRGPWHRHGGEGHRGRRRCG